MEKEIKIFDDKKSLITYLKDQWYKRFVEAVREKGFYTSVLSGGNTPLAFYEELPGLNNIPWEKVSFFLADERYVDPASINSNYGNIKKALFDKIPIPAQNIYAFKTGLFDPPDCAAAYEKAILDFFHGKQTAVPVFDFILLGLGDDGHTASIFPGEKALLETEHTVLAAEQKHTGFTRLSLSLQSINRGKNIYFMVCGKSKAQMISFLLKDKREDFPSAQIRPLSGKVTFLLDTEAACLL